MKGMHRLAVLLVLVLMAMLAIAGCGGSSDGGNPPPQILDVFKAASCSPAAPGTTLGSATVEYNGGTWSLSATDSGHYAVVNPSGATTAAWASNATPIRALALALEAGTPLVYSIAGLEGNQVWFYDRTGGGSKPPVKAANVTAAVKYLAWDHRADGWYIVWSTDGRAITGEYKAL